MRQIIREVKLQHFDQGPVIMHQGAFGLTENQDQKQISSNALSPLATVQPLGHRTQHEKPLNCHLEKECLRNVEDHHRLFLSRVYVCAYLNPS